MTRASVTDLASRLSLHDLPPDSLGAFYDEALLTLGTFPQLFDITVHDAVLTDDATFTLPDNYHTLHNVWYGSRILDPMSHATLLAHSPYWRDHKAPPIAYITEHLNSKDYRLYPAPIQPSAPPLFTPGGPFGQGFPSYHVTLLATMTTENLPVWLDLPMALLVLQREYSRASDHMDIPYANGCQTLAQMFIDMLRIAPME